MGERLPRDMMIWFFLALFMLSIYLLGMLLWPFVSVIIIAAVVTGVTKPLYVKLTTRMRPPVASLVTCCLIFMVLFVPIVFFVGILSREAYGLYLMGKTAVISDQVRSLMAASQILEKVNPVLGKFNIELTGDELHRALSETGKVVGLFLYQQASAIASNVANFFVYFFFMLLVAYYLLIDGERLARFIVDLSPLPDDQDEQLIQKFKDMAGAVLIGNGLCGLLQGVAGGVVFSIFGFNSAFLWGVIMGLLAFLPILGIGAVFIPAAGYLVLSGRVGAGIFFIVFYALLSGGVEYLIKPRLVGQRVKMHTLLVFLSIIGGLKMFGILGIIYGPLVITGFLTLTEIYHTSYQAEGNSAGR
jgi:predicted PurR-regulated permease PerM